MPVEALHPLQPRIRDPPGFKPPVEERHEGERPRFEAVEVELRSDAVPGAPGLLVGTERRGEETFLFRGRPERQPASALGLFRQVGGVSLSSPAAARRRSSEALRTWRYCPRDSRSRKPLFWAWRRRSSTTSGSTC